ncbi:hypothetical protein B0J13DRAFT_534312 [Dactylonectria estremocensis]|uniref:Uncharacterized protein n=1 Tax=Dactylonectria estremocensis TaxID=1079267 RepID=A0A9P9D306_9HYPO|nr:hypothetical protein B0J13DRAFT_534312 [Dactylonectria estremocensis]
MRRSLPFLIPSLLVAQLAAAQNTIDKICSGIQDIYGCTTSFKVPSGIKVETCPQKVFEWVPCKTKTVYKYPCPTWPKPGRMCDGWTCVPGTQEKWIKGPCGLTVLTTNVDLCQQVRGVLGNQGSQFISKAGAICKCFPRAVAMAGAGLFDSLSSSGDFSSAMSTLIGDAITLQKCMLDKGFNIQDTKDKVLVTDLASTDGWTVVRAKEIDLATYGELIAAISPCFTGPCNPDLIRTFFTNYLTESKELMADQITDVLTGWINIFDGIKEKILEIENAARSLSTHLQTVPDKVQAVLKKICKNGECQGPAISSFVTKVTKAIDTMKAVQDIKKAADTVAEVVPKLIDQTHTVIEVTETVPDAQFLLDMIEAGNLRKISDIFEAIQVTKELPKLAAELREAISPVGKLITDYRGQGEDALALLKDVVSISWEDYANEFKANSTHELRTGLIEIQSIIQSDLQEPLQNLTEAIQGLSDVFSTFPIKEGRFQLEAKVASYQRWSTVSMDMPCSKWERQTFKRNGFRASFDYPKFWRCPYGPKRLPWPNHHIPYIKFRIE